MTYSTSPTTVGGTVTYFENSLPGVAFFPSTKAFTQPTTGTVAATAGFTNLSGSTNQYYTMTVTPTSTFSGGNILYFTVGRGFARSASTGGTFGSVTSATTGGTYWVADIFGGGVSIPSGTVTTNGMSFSGTTADGGTFTRVHQEQHRCRLVEDGWLRVCKCPDRRQPDGAVSSQGIPFLINQEGAVREGSAFFALQRQCIKPRCKRKFSDALILP